MGGLIKCLISGATLGSIKGKCQIARETDSISYHANLEIEFGFKLYRGFKLGLMHGALLRVLR